MTARHLIRFLKGKRKQLTKNAFNVVFWANVIYWDERRIAIESDDAHRILDTELAALMRTDSWRDLDLAVFELHARDRFDLVRTYICRASRPEGAKDIERQVREAFLRSWFVSEAYEVRTLESLLRDENPELGACKGHFPTSETQ